MKYNEYEIGQRVQVSDGEKRPPDRFNRKLAAWKNSNYIGRVSEIREPSEYSPGGRLVLKRDDYPDRNWITFQFDVPVGGYLKIEPILEAEAA